MARYGFLEEALTGTRGGWEAVDVQGVAQTYPNRSAGSWWAKNSVKRYRGRRPLWVSKNGPSIIVPASTAIAGAPQGLWSYQTKLVGIGLDKELVWHLPGFASVRHTVHVLLQWGLASFSSPLNSSIIPLLRDTQCNNSSGEKVFITAKGVQNESYIRHYSFFCLMLRPRRPAQRCCCDPLSVIAFYGMITV